MLIVSLTSCNVSAFDPATIVVLNWNAGNNSIYPEQPMKAMNLRAFRTNNGHTLAKYEDLFKEQVRLRVENILSDTGFLIVVVNDSVKSCGVVETTVHLTQEMAPKIQRNDPCQSNKTVMVGENIGRATYDPCNKYHNDEAVILGGRICRLGNGYTFDEWVNFLANVCSHEVAHTLGFGHIPRSECLPTEQVIELMLDGFTLSEMRRPHRIIVSQTNCPDLRLDGE